MSVDRSFPEILRKLPVPPERLSALDLGCGYGDYLAPFGRDSVGLEFDDERLAACRERGLNVLKWTFMDPFPAELEERRFDLVLMSHFLEHVFSPHQVLMEARRHLNPGGLLLIHVPVVNPLMRVSEKVNRKRRLPLGFHAPLYGDHVNFFTTGTLAVTCEFAGFETVYLGTPYLPGPLSAVVRWLWPTTWYLGRRVEGWQYGEASVKSLGSDGKIGWKARYPE